MVPNGKGGRGDTLSDLPIFLNRGSLAHHVMGQHEIFSSTSTNPTSCRSALTERMLSSGSPRLMLACSIYFDHFLRAESSGSEWSSERTSKCTSWISTLPPGFRLLSRVSGDSFGRKGGLVQSVTRQALSYS